MTVLADAAGEVTIEVPRGRAGRFEPVIVNKRQRRLNAVDGVAISLFAGWRADRQGHGLPEGP